MSWHNELVPPSLTLRSLCEDCVAAWGMYAAAGLPLRERMLFLALRGIQRLAYGVGWSHGRRALPRPHSGRYSLTR